MKVEQELRGFVQAVADVSPEPPLLDSQTPRVQRRLAPVVAVAAGFAAALVLVGGGAVWMFADDADSPPTGPSDPSELIVSPTKQEILADGVVTQAEYRAAVDAVVGCMAAEGIDTSVRYDSSGIAAFDSHGPGAADKFDACFAQHLGSVAYAWANQNANPESEIAFYNDVVDCVEAQTGESYGDVEAVGDTRPTDAAIAAAPDLYETCLNQTFSLSYLTGLVETAKRTVPPPNLEIASSSIDEVTNEGTADPVETVLMGTVKFNSDPNEGTISVNIVVDAPWDPEAEIRNTGGAVSLATVEGVGDALVDFDEPGISIAFPLPDAVVVTVNGRNVSLDVIEAFAAQLRTDLIQSAK